MLQNSPRNEISPSALSDPTPIRSGRWRRRICMVREAKSLHQRRVSQVPSARLHLEQGCWLLAASLGEEVTGEGSV